MGSLKAKLSKDKDSVSLSLSGILDETAETKLNAIDPARVGQHVVIDCQGLLAVNSLGIRHLTDWVAGLHQYTTFAYEACTPVLIEVIRLLPNLLHAENVRSVEIPYSCGQCSHTEHPVFVLDELPESRLTPDFVCQKCSGTMTPMLDVAEYLDFFCDMQS